MTRPRPSRPARGLAVLAVTLAALTACGGDDGTDGAAATSAEAPAAGTETSASESAPAEAGESQTLTATEGEMFIELSTEDLGAGSYTIEVVNEGSATHDFVVERDGSDVAATDTIAPGASTTLTVDLEPGEYVFYCSVGNHRDMGMEVTVTVT